jgi:hypothetical protein
MGISMPPRIPRRQLGFNFGLSYLAERDQESLWLTAWFASRILERDEEESGRLGRKPMVRINSPRRLAGWRTSAENFLSRPNPPTLQEIVDIIGRIFEEHDGVLPIEIVNGFSPTGWTTSKHYRLTRLIQVFENWDRLVEVMAMPVSDRLNPQEAAVETPTPGPIAVPDLDAKVTNLVDLFEAFRHSRNPQYELDDFHRSNWSKTFRIVLQHGQRDYDTMKLVVETLADRDIDEFVTAKNRYFDPFTLKTRFAEALDHVQLFRDLKARHPERFDKTPRPRPEPEPVTAEQLREIGFDESYIEAFLERRLRAQGRQRTWDDDDEVDYVTTDDVLAKLLSKADHVPF